MCQLMEQMRNETAEKTLIAAWTAAIQKLNVKLKISEEDAAELLQIPEDARESVFTALHAN